jgi:hypothetical protein
MPLIDSYLLDEPDTASTTTFPSGDADVPLHLRRGAGGISYGDDSASYSISLRYSSSYFPSASGGGSARSINDTPLFQFPSIPSPSPSPNDFYPIHNLDHRRDHDLEIELPSPPHYGPYNRAFCRAHFGTFPSFAPFPTFSFSHLLTDHVDEEPQSRLAFVFGIGEEAEFTFGFPYVEDVFEETILSEEVGPVRPLSEQGGISEVSEHMPLHPLKSNPVLASQPGFRLQQSRPVRPSIYARRGAKPLQTISTDRK